MVFVKTTGQLLAWPVLFFSLFFSALFGAWIILASVDFLYAANYRLINIEQTIQSYAPRNQYKTDFALTNKEEHHRLFGKISDSIFSDGKNLSNIYYKTPEGKVIDTLLTPAEITHLVDVSNLVSIINYIGVTVIVIALMLGAILCFLKQRPQSIIKMHMFGLLILLTTVIAVLVAGAEHVFYQMHTWIFPKDHQWFFYYEESLMTTLMKAPDLFALIAVELLIVALTIYGLMLYAVSRTFSRFQLKR